MSGSPVAVYRRVFLLMRKMRYFGNNIFLTDKTGGVQENNIFPNETEISQKGKIRQIVSKEKAVVSAEYIIRRVFIMKEFICTLNGPCFGHERSATCSVLTETPSTYSKGFCPFQKPQRDVTNGIRYPYMYAKTANADGEDQAESEE